MNSDYADPRRLDFRAAFTTAEPIPMADPIPQPWLKYIANAALVAATIAGWVLYLTGHAPQPPAPPVLIRQAEPGQPVEPMPGFVPATGWVPDPDAVKRIVEGDQIPAFGDTPAGKVSQGDADVFLWRGVRKAAGLSDDKYPNVNQRDVGCCVGCGYKQSADVLLAQQVIGGAPQEWKPVAAEAIYALSRVEIGGGKLRGDGSVGAWAAKAISLYGVVPMEKVGSIDFTVFDPIRARRLGATGLPADVEAVARNYPVKGVAQVQTFADVQRAIQQGYPVPVCSDQGFTMARDDDGFCRPSGTWNHCMAIIGIRGGSRPGAFILNSWGDQAHTGPRYPADAPSAGFWADAKTVERMVSQGDTFALSDAAGFPARNIDWFSQVVPRHSLGFDREMSYALAR